ncbi:hypothetical protein CDD81_7454 [Ophiocordyceps australis]|uniref:Uncharacterized protein n=1 Tax=Ophiocordyceps australis TaxID=1399860 RepID=A0A2C5XBR0_9HYPO|nr:hypothetical protein CDD81_7454 [Ophiocordyceps australis]
MCFTTEQYPEQASNILLVNKANAMLGRHKERLYIGLYVRGSASKMPGGEDEYHWAFLAGPKKHPRSGSRHIMYHAKENLVVSGDPPQVRRQWAYVNDSDRAAMLLVRIVVGKIVDRERLNDIFTQVPLGTDDPDYNCVFWMQDAFRRVLQDSQAVRTTVSSWESVRQTAMEYVGQKKLAHRFDGKDTSIIFDPLKPATWDMLLETESSP